MDRLYRPSGFRLNCQSLRQLILSLFIVGTNQSYASDYFESVDSNISLTYSDYIDYSLVSATDLDVNLDGSADLVFHFFSSEDGLSGDC
jgi:hypothetical protein